MYTNNQFSMYYNYNIGIPIYYNKQKKILAISVEQYFIYLIHLYKRIIKFTHI